MLITARQLVARLRQPRSRSDEVRDLRRRLVRARRQLTDDQRREGRALRRLREELAAAAGTIDACSGCARGCSQPAGRWDGGHCCSGNTAHLFCDDEVAALAAGGTRPGQLAGPHGDHAGCAFRGATGCSLSVANRPSRCVLYLCRDATRELHAAARLDHVEALAAQLSAAHARFVRARRSHELDRLLGL